MREQPSQVRDLYLLINNLLLKYNNLKETTTKGLVKIIEEHENDCNNLDNIQLFLNDLYYLKFPDDNTSLDGHHDFYYVYSSDLFIYLIIKEALTNDINYQVINNDSKYNIVNNKLNIIKLVSVDGTNYKNFIKEYAINNNLHIIQNLLLTKEKTYTELISKYHGNNFIIMPYAGLAFDVKNRTLIYNPYLANTTRSNIEFKQFLFLAYSTNQINDNITLDINNNIEESTSNLINLIKPKFEWMETYILEEKILSIRKDRLNENITELQNTISHLKDCLKNTLESLNDRQYELYYMNNKEQSYKVSSLIERLKKEHIIHHVYLEGNTLNIYWYALPVTFFDNEKLNRALDNYSISDKRKQNLLKVVNNDYILFTAPLKTCLDLSNLNFCTYRLGNYNDNLYNQHPLYYSNKGCRGTFDVPFMEAQKEGNLFKTIMLLKQYYQSITINDILGNNFCAHALIVDENNNIVNTDTSIYAYFNMYHDYKEDNNEH